MLHRPELEASLLLWRGHWQWSRLSPMVTGDRATVSHSAATKPTNTDIQLCSVTAHTEIALWPEILTFTSAGVEETILVWTIFIFISHYASYCRFYQEILEEVNLLRLTGGDLSCSVGSSFKIVTTRSRHPDNHNTGVILSATQF